MLNTPDKKLVIIPNGPLRTHLLILLKPAKSDLKNSLHDVEEKAINDFIAEDSRLKRS
jgi:hypothetical protein